MADTLAKILFCFGMIAFLVFFVLDRIYMKENSEKAGPIVVTHLRHLQISIWCMATAIAVKAIFA